MRRCDIDFLYLHLWTKRVVVDISRGTRVGGGRTHCFTGVDLLFLPRIFLLTLGGIKSTWEEVWRCLRLMGDTLSRMRTDRYVHRWLTASQLYHFVRKLMVSFNNLGGIAKVTLLYGEKGERLSHHVSVRGYPNLLGAASVCVMQHRNGWFVLV
jgi:hypothetical protein